MAALAISRRCRCSIYTFDELRQALLYHLGLLWRLRCSRRPICCAPGEDAPGPRALRGGGSDVGRALGIDVFWIRLSLVRLCHGCKRSAGVAGCLYAHMTRFVSQAPFDLKAGIEYLLMAVLGGAGTISGAVVGAAAVALAKNWLQDRCRISRATAPISRSCVFGCLFILLLHKSRNGIVQLVRQYLPFRPDMTPPPAARRVRRNCRRSRRPSAAYACSRDRWHDQALWRPRCGRQCELRGESRNDHRSDRPERRRQRGTSFNLITGALKLTSGKVHLRPTTSPASSRMKSYRSAWRVPSSMKLRPTTTLLENVMLGCYQRTRSGLSSSGALKGARRRRRNERFMMKAMRELDARRPRRQGS